jgi:hypothetical protein
MRVSHSIAKLVSDVDLNRQPSSRVHVAGITVFAKLNRLRTLMNFHISHLRATVRIAVVATLAALACAAPANAGGDRDAPETLPWNGGSTKDGYPVPQGPPADYRSYKDDAPPPRPPLRRTSECLSKYGIQHALNRQGWHAFDAVEIRGQVAYMTARREEGRRFALQVDSCSGSVIDAQPIVVYSDRPVYYERPYYVPRPAVGFYFGGGYGGHRHWR